MAVVKISSEPQEGNTGDKGDERLALALRAMKRVPSKRLFFSKHPFSRDCTE